MKRGEIWSVSGTSAVIVQDDHFGGLQTITVCPFTTNSTPAPLFRLVVEPNSRNRLDVTRSLMVDKLTTVPKTCLGTRIGRLDDGELVRLNRAIAVFVGLAGARR